MKNGNLMGPGFIIALRLILINCPATIQLKIKTFIGVNVPVDSFNAHIKIRMKQLIVPGLFSISDYLLNTIKDRGFVIFTNSDNEAVLVMT